MNHFYRGVVCTKAMGGKHSLWHARKEGLVNIHGTQLVGAGGTAELAIADLQKSARLVWKRSLESVET